MPKDKKDNPTNPFDTSIIVNKIGAPEKEWRGAVANVFIATHRELHDMSGKLSRIEKQNIAVISILTVILVALTKTALGL